MIDSQYKLAQYVAHVPANSCPEVIHAMILHHTGKDFSYKIVEHHPEHIYYDMGNGFLICSTWDKIEIRKTLSIVSAIGLIGLIINKRRHCIRKSKDKYFLYDEKNRQLRTGKTLAEILEKTEEYINESV